ncbi:MAG: metallophosphoesterase family protein [Pseudomonadota bacterium]
MVRIGLISDTHGLMRPEALRQLAGSDFIVHGGDIGGQEILDQLGAIAPVTAVRGNNDYAPWAGKVPECATLQIGAIAIYAIHDIGLLPSDIAGSGIGVVVYGHSHRPLIEERAGVLYLNPGSAGPRRFKLPVSVGELVIDGSELSARIIELAV